MIKGILFDKDGTLVDFEATYGPATAKIIEILAQGDGALADRMAAEADFNRLAHRFGPKSVIVAETSLDIAGKWCPILKGWRQDRLAGELDRLYLKTTVDHVTPVADVRKALEALSEIGLALGIATNDSHTGAIAHRDKLGLTDLLPFVAGYDSGHGAKPAPGMILAFADFIGSGPDEVMMVGDSLHDIHAARAAGATAVAVTSGMYSADELAGEADHVLDSITDLPDFFAAL